MAWKCKAEGCRATNPHPHSVWRTFEFPSRSNPGTAHVVEWLENLNAEPTQRGIENRIYKCTCPARVRECYHQRNMREVHLLNLKYAKMEDV